MFLRPNTNVTQTNFTNGHAQISEVAANDADFAYGANDIIAVLEVGLTDPAHQLFAGAWTIRYRVAKTKAGAVDGGGNALTITAALYQGAVLISADTARTPTGTWTAYSWVPVTSGVTDWNDVRLRFTTTASGGAAADQRGGAVSWAEIEIPDFPYNLPATPKPRHASISRTSVSTRWVAPSSLKDQVHVRTGKQYMVELDYPPMTAAQAGAWISFFEGMNGYEGTFSLSIDAYRPAQAALGTLTWRLASPTVEWDLSLAKHYGFTLAALQKV